MPANVILLIRNFMSKCLIQKKAQKQFACVVPMPHELLDHSQTK